MNNKKQQWFFRILFYVCGAVILAGGVTLNTKTGLGVSPVISMPYTIAHIWNLSFSMMTFVVYSLLVLLEFLLKGKNRQWRDVLQVPFAFVFSLFLELFDRLFAFQLHVLWQNILLHLAGVFATGAGMALMVNMKLIPNPADGLAQAIGAAMGKDMGLGKNILDISSVCITCLIGLIFAHRLVGIGIGTIIAMIGVGRSVAVVNWLFKEKMMRLSGTD